MVISISSTLYESRRKYIGQSNDGYFKYKNKSKFSDYFISIVTLLNKKPNALFCFSVVAENLQSGCDIFITKFSEGSQIKIGFLERILYSLL